MYEVSTGAAVLVGEILGCGIFGLDKAYDILNEADINVGSFVCKAKEELLSGNYLEPINLALEIVIEEASEVISRALNYTNKERLSDLLYAENESINGNFQEAARLIKSIPEENRSEVLRNKAVQYLLINYLQPYMEV